MNIKKIGSSVITTLSKETIKGITEISQKYSSNYNNRRSVGFDVIPSITGAFTDTRKYYSSILKGVEPKEMIPAIYFEEE